MKAASKYELSSLKYACGLHLSKCIKTAKSFTSVLEAMEISIEVKEICLSAATFSYLMQNINALVKSKNRDRMIDLFKGFMVQLLEELPPF